MFLSFDMGDVIVTGLLVVCGLLLLGVAGLSIATYIVTKKRARLEEERRTELEDSEE